MGKEKKNCEKCEYSGLKIRINIKFHSMVLVKLCHKCSPSAVEPTLKYKAPEFGTFFRPIPFIFDLCEFTLKLRLSACKLHALQFIYFFFNKFFF